jgi:predicted naringenin-chalcone synthase
VSEATISWGPRERSVGQHRRAAHSFEPARLSGLALATPSCRFTQDELLELLGLTDDQFATSIFARSGVAARHLTVTEQSVARTLQARTATTEDELFRLAVEAINELSIDPREIGVVVTGTYYSLGGPTLAHRVVDHYSLDPATDKYHLVGVGCASAVPLFRLALGCLRDWPERKALVVAAESISGFLTGAAPGDDKVKVVGSALFGDGCAAALLGSARDQASGPAIVATAVHQVPETLDYVRFSVTGDDSHLNISRELPALAEGRAAGLVESFLGEQGLAMADIDHWLMHPGGRGIVEALQRALRLSDEQVAPSVGVLSEFGNVGTPSGLFVLAKTLAERRPSPGDRALMLTIGPGVTVGLMLLAWSNNKNPDQTRR